MKRAKSPGPSQARRVWSKDVFYAPPPRPHPSIHPSHYYVIRCAKSGLYLYVPHERVKALDADKTSGITLSHNWTKSWGLCKKFITIGPTDGRRLCQVGIQRACEKFGLDASLIAPQRVYAPTALLTGLLVKQYGITQAEIDAPGLPVNQWWNPAKQRPTTAAERLRKMAKACAKHGIYPESECGPHAVLHDCT